MAKKARILAIGDAVTPTGFSTVMHGILGNLPQKQFEIHHLGVNYIGDPHEYLWKIYPAKIQGMGDHLGISRLKTHFAQLEWDGIFILNDIWVIDQYLRAIKESFQKIPPIVVYFPIDSMEMDATWVNNFDIVTQVVVYTQFGFDELRKVYDRDNVSIIPHGLNTDTFKKISNNRKDVRKLMLPDDPNFQEAFIVLSASRNQPRKRLDIALEAFSIFSKDKPKTVKFYAHCGVKDVGYDILKLAVRYKMDDRLILTSTQSGIQSIPVEKLNLIYNACDVGINTSIGEGWSLTNMEHAATGAPQVVPDHSVMPEIFSDCSVIVPTSMNYTNLDTLTVGKLVKPSDVAEKLELIYHDKKLYKELAENALRKFSSDKYTWKTITQDYWMPIFEDAYQL